MNDGEVVVCIECERPFEILRRCYGGEIVCPYCEETIPAQ